MFYMPYNFFFFCSLVLSVLISISSSNWVWVWVGMEINMLSFIPLMSSIKDNYIFSVVECSVKYFMVQALGSGLFLLGYLLMLMKNMSGFSSYSLLLIIFSFLIKLGAAPFHVWFPLVMKGLSWFSCGVLMILQKIIPLMLLSAVFSGLCPLFMLVFCILGPLVGGVGGLNQVNLRVSYIIKYIMKSFFIKVFLCYLFMLQLEFKNNKVLKKVKSSDVLCGSKLKFFFYQSKYDKKVYNIINCISSLGNLVVSYKLVGGGKKTSF